MTAIIRSRDDFYQIYKNAATAVAGQLTDWTEGSINDGYAGGASTAMSELVVVILQEFAKTFINSSDGDDLENLAVDHFGADFARPDSQKAVGIVKFSRPNADFGDVVIPAGTVVKTEPDANGATQSFKTLLDITMTGTEINASIEALEAGVAGNVDDGLIVVVESALLDTSIAVNNDFETAGGAAEEDDPTYRQTILRLIEELKGATLSAIRAKALNVSGIEWVTAVEQLKTVIEWDDATQTPIGNSFRMPFVKLYVADANGQANDALIALVDAAILVTRAAGAKIEIISGTAYTLDWDVSITLKPTGPNYAEFQNDTSKILASMEDYLSNLDIGADFDRDLADTAILAIWGPEGTDDLSNFTTNKPTGDISTAANEKIIPGTMSTS